MANKEDPHEVGTILGKSICYSLGDERAFGQSVLDLKRNMRGFSSAGQVALMIGLVREISFRQGKSADGVLDEIVAYL